MSNVNHPQHYNKYPHEVIELTERFSNNMGNVLKYILRAPYKGKYEEDLNKASWYLMRIVKNKQKLDKVTKDTQELASTFQNELINNILKAAKNKNYDELYSIADFISKTKSFSMEQLNA